MATTTAGAADQREFERDSFGATVWRALELAGSLKITVGLFAASLILVLVGTLAQDEMNMLEVKQRYFLAWFTFLHFDDFFPQAFFPHAKPLPGKIPFLGGSLIGVLLMLNLAAAKSTRFRVHASGGRLIAGNAFLLAGTAVAGWIIYSGNSSEGLQGNPPIEYDRFWALILASLAALGLGAVGAAIRADKSNVRTFFAASAIGLAAFVGYSLLNQWRIGDPGLRIVWQLTKGFGAGLILLVGCRLLFDKQGGNVLLHLGVGLLMAGQFAFGDRQLEQRLSLVEGESTNTLVNFDAVELAFISEENDEQQIIAIPSSRLIAALESEEIIKDDALPVHVRVLEYFPNSNFKKDVSKENPATAGLGLEIEAKDMPKSGGAESKQNLASAYVEFIDKDSDETIGTHLVSQLFSDRKLLVPDGRTGDLFDEVQVGEESYEVGLRFHREVKPYWVHLEDVRRVDYTGSDMVKDFSSFIRIVDTETGVDRRERVWMNNPLRYRGETFYQSNYTPLDNGKEMTGIQVVQNSGWLIPYLACGITALGMLAHFLGTLTRFLNRRERETRKQREELAEFNLTMPSQRPVYLALGGYTLLAIMMLIPWSAVIGVARPTPTAQPAAESDENQGGQGAAKGAGNTEDENREDEKVEDASGQDADVKKNAARPDAIARKYDFYTAGQIPVQFGGRMMPLDAYARQTLKAMSNKESLSLDDAPTYFVKRAQGRRLSAMQWLMEVATDQRKIRLLRMFRIDAEEIRAELDLDRRKSKLYSLSEIYERFVALRPQIQIASRKARNDAKSLTFKEKKLLELDSRTSAFMRTATCFQLPAAQVATPRPGEDPAMAEVRAFQELEQRLAMAERFSPPSIIPPSKVDVDLAEQSAEMPKWSPFGPAYFNNLKEEFTAGPDETVVPRPGIDTFSSIIQAYDDQDVDGFNQAIDAHLVAVHEYSVPRYSRKLVVLERWMQSNWPTGVATFFYLNALVLGLIFFMANMPRLRQVVWGTLILALIIHTIAIICRIAITQRAPVINIYSSAVFIGWGAVLFGLGIERIYRNGMGNELSAVSGVLTLLVAYGLNTGDTMPVLQAVLDTQFWLATHVISVTLGYVATLVAGTLGIGYLVCGWLGKDPNTMRDLYRSCYGAACFGILFSFVGTVLGGLWADDSWGRFWGWDPKENGALLIVIWNALMLHARWDGMVKARGFAILAIGGNIVTAWSWFGTNELGIGLHSYGFTSGVLMWLTVFVFTQIACILAGLFLWREPTALALGGNVGSGSISTDSRGSGKNSASAPGAAGSDTKKSSTTKDPFDVVDEGPIHIERPPED